MKDIFSDYILQREELLARIAQELQLNKTRLERMKSAYNAVSELLKNDEDFFEGLEIEIYAQGSTRIETTVKPINNEDFDLDAVLHIYDPYFNHSPEEIYSALVKALEKDDYYKDIMEKKTRCVRLNYKGDFHMDILPACMPDFFEKEKIKIPEKALKAWSSGNPKGFAKWFLRISNTVGETLLKRHSQVLLSQVEAEPLPEELYSKTPLQRAVQLIKRYRDIYYEKRDYRVSSIVITTLAAHFYQGETSIYESIDQIVARISNEYQDAIRFGYRFKVLNPVNGEEDFTDSWSEQHYQSFFDFISAFQKKWQSLKETFKYSNKEYIELFGEGIYKKSLNEQHLYFSQSTNDPLIKSSSLITSGIAYTNSKGNINRREGVKNEAHHSYGGDY
ncbi:nucleotidyltransferase [Echinicola marina]|uniref:nucleotidyltransferase domain-containing protein n=1 Tax=Echinicola marina TaxID=2859768 RepID=UPI001CF69318|nr:nucleotidyltransferase [Echinicola marina]UCS93276.1 nucleotidyltransferase [Echinicola marina]